MLDLRDISFDVADRLWGKLIQYGPIQCWTVEDLVANIEDVSTIIKLSRKEGLLEEDTGLYDHNKPFAVVPAMAFFSLVNLVYAEIDHQIEIIDETQNV
jgi:hypothetical protein